MSGRLETCATFLNRRNFSRLILSLLSSHRSRVIPANTRSFRESADGCLDRSNRQGREVGEEARNRRIFALWMACYTQEEIAEREGISKMEVSRVCNEMANLPKSYKAAAEHATDFTVPVYNVWKQQRKGG